MNISMSELRGHVLVSRERVKFADADPYGHLASGAYVDMMMNHRVEALDDLIGISIVRYARSGIAFPARAIEVSYLRPAFVGDRLEIGSWIDTLGGSSFEVRALVTGADDRIARTAIRTQFVTVDSRSAGRSRCPTCSRVPQPSTRFQVFNRWRTISRPSKGFLKAGNFVSEIRKRSGAGRALPVPSDRLYLERPLRR